MFSFNHFPNITPSLPLLELDRRDEMPIIEGVDEFNILCPVNHLTGDRENILNLLGLILNDSKSQLLSKFIKEIPASQEFKGLPDDLALEFVADGLTSGIPYERDRVLKDLQKVADVVLPALGHPVSVPSDSSDVKTEVQTEVSTE